jgi:cation transport ATPase
MAVPELRERKPGMMTLISLAISVAFIYSVAAQFINLGEGFFWELVTLIDIMLLGHGWNAPDRHPVHSTSRCSCQIRQMHSSRRYD